MSTQPLVLDKLLSISAETNACFARQELLICIDDSFYEFIRASFAFLWAKLFSRMIHIYTARMLVLDTRCVITFITVHVITWMRWPLVPAGVRYDICVRFQYRESADKEHSRI